MKVLYWGRHGSTEDLEAGRRSRHDTKLTKNGRTEMQRAGELLVVRGIQPDLIVRSELPRAKESAETVAKIIGYDLGRILHNPVFNERMCGIAEGMFNAEIKERWPDGFDTIPGAETLEQLQRRAAAGAAFLRKLKAETVLVIAHGTLGRAMIREFEGKPHTDENTPGRLSFKRGQIMRLYPQPTTVLVS